MSYDNDLASFGPVILDALEHGVQGTGFVVTVLADDTERDGLRRYSISSQGRAREILNTDNSASEDVLSDYLHWVTETYPAKHYGVVFLDHGGRLDDMCLDKWPDANDQERWLSARLVGGLLREFRKRVPGEVDLLFLQQCGRASLENLYNFRGAVRRDSGVPDDCWSAQTPITRRRSSGWPHNRIPADQIWLGK